MNFYTGYSKEHKAYVGYCTDFPEVQWVDKNEEEAYECVIHATIVYIEKLIIEWSIELKNDVIANLSLCLSSNSDRIKELNGLENKLKFAYDCLQDEEEE